MDDQNWKAEWSMLKYIAGVGDEKRGGGGQIYVLV